jgi:hypothetical protein
VRLEPPQAIGIVERVQLVGDGDLRLGEDVGRVRLQLLADDLEVVHRLTAGLAGDVHQMHQHFGAFDVLQELVAEPMSFVGALDESGHVGDDEAAIAAQRHDAEVGRERGEGVVGDLRTRGRDARDERGLAGVGEADQADVGDQLQAQVEQLLLAGDAGLGAPWCAVGGRDEPCVAASAPAALGDQHALPLLDQIGELVSVPFAVFSKTSVPIGTATSRSLAVHPVRLEPWPCCPCRALNSG